MIRRARTGVAYLSPEIQLLYKARPLRDKDQLDFESAAPFLHPNERAWPRDAIEVSYPDHRWHAVLRHPSTPPA